MKYLELLKASFLWDKQLNKAFFIEFLFIIFIVLFSVIWFFVMDGTSGVLENPIVNVPNSELNGTLLDAIQYFILFFAGTFLLLLTYLISFTLSRSLVWTTFLNQKLNSRIYGKFLLTHIFWFIIWLPVLILFFIPLFMAAQAYQTYSISEMAYLVIFLINFALWLVISYFSLFLYRSFFTHHKVYMAITEAFKCGLLKFHKIALPLLISLAVWLIWWGITLLLGLMGVNKLFGDIYWLPVSLISLYLFMCLRRYLIHFTGC